MLLHMGYLDQYIACLKTLNMILSYSTSTSHSTLAESWVIPIWPLNLRNEDNEGIPTYFLIQINLREVGASYLFILI